MRKFLILTLALAAGPLRAEEEAFQYAPYEILIGHPGCSGTGYVAYKTHFDIVLEDAIHPIGTVAPTCSLTVNRGDKSETLVLPCKGATDQAVDAEEFLASDAFCPATQQMRPATIRFRGEFVGCISVAGHAIVGGSWEATVARPTGTTVVSGQYDDPRLELTYISTSDRDYSGVAPSLSIWLDLEDEALATLPDAVIGTVGHIQFLPLIDSSQPGCGSDPKACWPAVMEVDPSAVFVERTETARICQDTDEDAKFGTYIARKALERIE